MKENNSFVGNTPSAPQQTSADERAVRVRLGGPRTYLRSGVCAARSG